MRRFRLILVALAILLFLGGLSVWRLLETDFFWRWSGWRIVAWAQDRVHGEVNVREIRGGPLTGLYFGGVTIKGLKGEVLQADRVELRFSFWSFIKLQPVIANLTIYSPHLQLREDEQGHWNVSGLLRPKPPPPFHIIDFPQILVKGGKVDLRRAGVTQQYQDIDLQLALTVLHPRRPQQAIQVHRSHLAVTAPQGRFGLSTSFTYSHQLLNLKSLIVAAGDRPLVTLTGEVRLKETEPGFNLAGEFGPTLGGEIQRLWPKWPTAWDLGGKFKVTGTPAQLLITGEGVLQKAKYILQGKVTPGAGEWSYDLGLHLTHLQPELLSSWNNAWEQQVKDLEPLSARLRLKGTGLLGPPGRLDWSLECQPFRFREAKVEELQLALTGDDREQRLEGVIRGNFGQLKVGAAGKLLAAPAGDLKIQGERFQVAPWGLPGLAGSLMDGKFTGKFTFPGSIPSSTLQVSGEVEAQGQFLDQPLKELRGRLKWDGSKLEIPQAQLRLGTLNAELKGTVERKGLDVHYRGNLAADGTMPWLPATLRGKLEGEGTLKGPWDQPQFTIQAKGHGLSGEGLAVESLAIKARGAGWPPLSGHLELKGVGLKTPVGVFAQASLSSQGEAGRWHFNFTAATPEGPEAEFKAAADLKGRPLSLRVERCRWRLLGISGYNTAPLQVRFLPGWELSPATFRVNEGLLTVQAQAKDGRLSGRLEAGDLPGDLLCIQGVPCKGKIKGLFTLSGTPLHPVIQGQFNLGPGKWGDFSFRNLQTSWNYRDARLHLSGTLEESAPGPRLTWEGQVPLHLSFSPPKWGWGDRDLQVRVQGEGVNLALLTALSPEVQAAEGVLDITAEWQGNPRHPRVSGQIRWGPGFLNFRQAGLPYKLLPGQARLQGEKILVPEISLESGGTARLTGDITLAGFWPQQVDARAQLQDFLVLRRGGTEATGNGNLTLTGPWSAPMLKGHLLLPRATFRPGFFRAEKHGDITLVARQAPPQPKGKEVQSPANLTFYRDLQMDLTLEAPGGVWLRDKRLNVELAGRIKIGKRPGQPAYAAGVVNTLKGTYELQGKNFKVQRGVIRLPGSPREEVTLEGQAIHEMDGLTLILNATGAASKPQVRLESIPPLPPPDLLSYLVFSRPARSLTREEYVTVGQQAVGVLGGITAEKIKELLGKDFPLVGDVTLRGSQAEGRRAVGVAKPLTKDLTVSFERKFDPLYRDNTEQVLLEYRFNRYLGVESQMGRRNTGADVLFNLDF